MSTINDSCQVQFWENDDYGSGGTYTFRYNELDGRPMYINNLADYYWDGYDHKAKNELDDSINSLKTGASAWLCLYTDSFFKGEVMMVGPGLDVNRLPSGFLNNVASFVLYPSIPNFWSPNGYSDTFQSGSCWLKLYLWENYGSSRSALYGAGDVVNTNCLQIGNRVQSLTTGPATWVKLYKEVNYADGSLVAQIGPNSLISDLNQLTTADINSIQVFDQMPAGFVATPITPGWVLSIQKYQTSKKLRNTLAWGVSLVPVAGGLLSGLLKALWPSGAAGTQEVWNDMEQYVASLMQGYIDQASIDNLNAILEGLHTMLDAYVLKSPGPDKLTKLLDIIGELQANQAYFLNKAANKEEHGKTLTYLVAFGTLSVVMGAELVYNYTTVSGGATNPDAATASLQLDAAIRELTTAVDLAVTDSVGWRLKQISNHHSGGSYTITDTYTGYTQKYSTQEQARIGEDMLRKYIGDKYYSLLEAYVSPANLWSYLLSQNVTQTPGQNPNFPTITFTQAPTPKLVSVQAATRPDTPKDSIPFAETTDASRVTQVMMSSLSSDGTGNCINALQFFYDDAPSAVHGTISSYSTIVPLNAAETAVIAAGADEPALVPAETIVAMHGNTNGSLYQLFFRTDQGRDFGLGGCIANNFVAIGPQGVGATLTTVAGTCYKTNQVNSLTLTWQYPSYERLASAPKAVAAVSAGA